MCGIAGQIGYDQDLRTQAETLKQMQAVLRRRGPDQEGLFLAEHAALAHTRLCVIDPENGRQPMTARRGAGPVRWCITENCTTRRSCGGPWRWRAGPSGATPTRKCC